ncbi:Disease resistance protein [Corchorus capsularis]|uniref:Disease resistance protein n=1 Tax=Corchorus capsularis TaxID=210143 RepID=A0A1R3I9Y7_COCAP|nr:Disease resistance protein [Corchorus capsularis]
MASTSVLCVTERISELLSEGADVYFKGVKEQVDGVVGALRATQSFLRHVETSSKRDEGDDVNGWDAYNKIRDLAHDAEDVIDTFLLKTRFGLGIKTRIIQQTRSEIDKLITEITRSAPKVVELGKSETDHDGELGLGASNSAYYDKNRKDYIHVLEDRFVGFENVREMVSVLVDDDHRRQVVSIVGMGGLGKTTLAKMVYRHEQVRNHFKGRAWVFVSQRWHTRKIWEQILDSLGYDDESESGGKQTEQELAEKLYNFLKDNKFLIVLDDIWTVEAWERIAVAFPNPEESKTKILLTTRNKAAAHALDPAGYTWELAFLNPEESWTVFENTAFPTGEIPGNSLLHPLMFLEGKTMP